MKSWPFGESISRAGVLTLSENYWRVTFPYFIEFHAREQRKVREKRISFEDVQDRCAVENRRTGIFVRMRRNKRERGREWKSTTRSQLSLIVLPRAMFTVIIYAAYMLPSPSNPSDAIRPSFVPRLQIIIGHNS